MPADSAAAPSDGVVWTESWETLQHWTLVDAGGGFGNNELQTYTPHNAHIEHGQLVITAIARRGLYTSAKLFSRRPLGRDAGYLEIETISFPQTIGLWPALWLLPTDGTETLHGGKVWPDGGEIDMLECFGAVPDAVHAAHWGTYEPHDAHKHHTSTSHLPHLSQQSHRIGLAFSGFSLTFYVDRKAVSSLTVPSPPFSSMALFAPIINLAMGGNLTRNVPPQDGTYVMRIGSITLYERPPGGWSAFNEAQLKAQRPV